MIFLFKLLTPCSQSCLNAKVARLQQVCGFRVLTHGDSAYAVNTNLCKGGGYNMSRTRICVEWGFQKIVSLRAGVDYDRRQQLFLTGPGSLYLTAGLLTNIHTCMYGSLTSRYFGIKPITRWRDPDLEQHMWLVKFRRSPIFENL